MSLVVPREVFKSAILNNSASIIVSHQHPSQDTSPSREDLEVTKRLVQCGKIVGIEVLDHVIVNREAGYYSMKRREYLNQRGRAISLFLLIYVYIVYINAL